MNRWRQVQTPPSQDAEIKCQFPHSCSELVKMSWSSSSCSSIPMLHSPTRDVNSFTAAVHWSSSAHPWNSVNGQLLLLQTLVWTWPLLKCVITAGWREGSCNLADSASLLAGVWGFQTFWSLSCEAVLKKFTSSRIHFFQRLVSQRNLRILRNL